MTAGVEGHVENHVKVAPCVLPKEAVLAAGLDRRLPPAAKEWPEGAPPGLRNCKPKSTREQPFRLNADKSVKTPMMYQKASFGYYTDREVQVLEMPYVGNAVTMCVLLPKKVDGLAAIEKKLSAAQLNQWLDRFRKTKVMVTLLWPRVSDTTPGVAQTISGF